MAPWARVDRRLPCFSLGALEGDGVSRCLTTLHVFALEREALDGRRACEHEGECASGPAASEPLVGARAFDGASDAAIADLAESVANGGLLGLFSVIQPSVARADDGSTQRIGGVTVGASGLALGVVALIARRQAIAVETAMLPNISAPDPEADRWNTIALVTACIGAAAIATGTVLYLTASTDAKPVGVAINGTGLSLVGRF